MELRPGGEARRTLQESWRQDRVVRLLVFLHLAVLAVFCMPEFEPLLRTSEAFRLARAEGRASQIPALAVYHYVDRYGSEDVLYHTYASLMVGQAVDVEGLRKRWGELGDLEPWMLPPERVRGPQVPYRDFGLEYPPGALPFFLLPRLAIADSVFYASAYRLQMGALVLASLAMVLWLQARRGSRPPARETLLLSFVALLALGPLTVQRLDAAVSFFLVASVVAVSTQRVGLGGGALAAAVGLKLWPVLLLPHYLRGRTPREARSFLGGFAIACAVLFGPWALLGPERLVKVLQFHGSRPLQLESTWASALELHHLLLLAPLEVHRSFGSSSVFSPAADALRPLAPVLLAALTLLVLFRYRRAGVEDLPRALAAGMLAVMLAAPVLSPQYLVSFFPLVFLMRDRVVPLLLLAAAGLTQTFYPWLYGHLNRLETAPILLLVLRNLTLAATFVPLLRRPEDRARVPGCSVEGEPR